MKKLRKKFKKIPAFRSEAEEAEFWATHDSADYVDWRKARRAAFPHLKPSAPKTLPAKAVAHRQ